MFAKELDCSNKTSCSGTEQSLPVKKHFLFEARKKKKTNLGTPMILERATLSHACINLRHSTHIYILKARWKPPKMKYKSRKRVGLAQGITSNELTIVQRLFLENCECDGYFKQLKLTFM
jgi:hypothetical protein